MQERTVVIAERPHIVLTAVPGDLRLAGWERPELLARTSGEVLDLRADGARWQITCDESLALYLPRRATLQVETVNGDVSLQALSGDATLGQIHGDLTLRDVSGAVTIESVSGDLSARLAGALSITSLHGDLVLHGGRGDLAATSINGDVSLRAIEGRVVLEQVGGDLYVRNVRGSLHANADGDAALYLQPQPKTEYRIVAHGDLVLRLPADVSARVHLTAPSPESLHVDFPDVSLTPEQSTQELTLGRETPEMAEIFLTAGGDLLVTTRAAPWEARADFGVGMGKVTVGLPIPPVPPIPPASPLPPDFSQRLRERIQTTSERARRKADAASRLAIKLEAAARRAEAKARRTSSQGKPEPPTLTIGQWNWDLTSHHAVDQETEATDEERLAILRMLQEKKITPEEAEKLLDALEGK